MLIEFKQKSQVTIPKALVEELGLKVGDKLDIDIEDGKLVITPVVIIPKSQEWFYTPEWQAKEKEVNKQLEECRLNVADSKEEIYRDLGLDSV
jgi:AbrB family looped-hinge helix DNA binding protein